MDVAHNGASMNEEDRISNLPDEIILRILSFLDMKYAIQTSTLSKKWKHVWTSMSYLNLYNQTFSTIPQFSEFVKKALSHRNHHIEVSAVKLSFTGTSAHFAPVVKSIIEYAYLHNVQHLTMIWFNSSIHQEFPECIFSSCTLKHLTLVINKQTYSGGCIPKLTWDFPALETLNLSNLQLGDCRCKSLELFSKCVNLKDLTLNRCFMYYLEFFNVCAPQLCNLTITDPIAFPKVFNVVAPQLKNLTASVSTTILASPAVLKSNGSNFLQLSTEGLNSLEKVNLYMPRSTHIQKIYVPQLLNLFQKLHSAKFLILDPYIIQTLSLGLDQLLCEPCPFISLKCLKISTPKKDRIAEISAEIKKYLLESSPSATFIMDIPQVPQKRSRQEADKDTMAKKVAKLEEEKQTMAEEKRTLEEEKQTMAEEKRTLEEEKHTMAEEKRMLEAKIKMQDGVIAEQKAMMLQQEKLTSRMINCKMAELQVQVAGGDPGYELIRLIKSIMDLTLESSRVAMEAQVSSLYEEMKSLFFTSIDVGEWAKIEMELGITERNRSNNNVPAAAAALQLVSSPSLADVVTSSSIGNAWSG